MKKIILFIVFFLFCSLSYADGDSTPIVIILEETSETQVDRSLIIEAYYFSDSSCVEIRSNGCGLILISVINSANEIISSSNFLAPGCNRLLVPFDSGIYTLCVDSGATHLSGQYEVQ